MTSETAPTQSKKSSRDRLIDAAMELFHRHGFEATSIAQILEQAQANAGSLYHHFADKEDLLLAVLDRYLELLDPIVMEPAFATAGDPVERVFAVLAGYRVMLIHTSCSQGCPIGNLILELADSKPKARPRLAALFDAWTSRIRVCIEDAADRFPPELDRDALANFVLTVMEGAVMQARVHRNLDVYDQSVAQLRRHFELLQRNTSDSDPGGAS